MTKLELELLDALERMQTELRISRDFRSAAMCAAIAHNAIAYARAIEEARAIAKATQP